MLACDIMVSVFLVFGKSNNSSVFAVRLLCKANPSLACSLCGGYLSQRLDPVLACSMSRCLRGFCGVLSHKGVCNKRWAVLPDVPRRYDKKTFLEVNSPTLCEFPLWEQRVNKEPSILVDVTAASFISQFFKLINQKICWLFFFNHFFPPETVN